MTAGLRYDLESYQRKSAAYHEAVHRIEAGQAPESLGFPNIGIPAPIPIIPITHAGLRSAATAH